MVNIDLTKNDFESLNPVAGELKAITGVKKLTGLTRITFADGTIKEAPYGGYLVELSTGEIKLLSNQDYERLLIG